MYFLYNRTNHPCSVLWLLMFPLGKVFPTTFMLLRPSCFSPVTVFHQTYLWLRPLLSTIVDGLGWASCV